MILLAQTVVLSTLTAHVNSLAFNYSSSRWGEFAASANANFGLCHPDYGRELSLPPGASLTDQLPDSEVPVFYQVDNKQAQYHIPFEKTIGDVMLSVEISGPVQISQVQLVPRDVRTVAERLVHWCLPNGIGGFMTLNFEGTVRFLTNPQSIITEPYPTSAAFLTIAMTRVGEDYPSPGDFDPEVAYQLRLAESRAIQRLPVEDVDGRELLETREALLQVQEHRMHRLGTVKWYDFAHSSGISPVFNDALTSKRRTLTREI